MIFFLFLTTKSDQYDGTLVHTDSVHLQELDRILHRKVEGDADFPFGTSKVLPNRPIELEMK